MVEVSEDMEKYFLEIEEKVKEAYVIAEEARKKGLDPESKVDIPLARNMAERVEGLISAVAPQIKDSGMLERFLELEKKYAKLDWRVALEIALEIAKEKFCKFESKKEAMEVAIRVGLAYLTLGVVASPLEGFTRLELKKRKDNGKEYFCLFFSGPIRSAGTTVVCGSIVVADYVRKEMGYAAYDPTEEEVKRMVTELYDYHEKVTNLQYLPSEKEIEFLVKNLPVQIDGDPSERYEVSNYKDLDRIKTNVIRNGPCLVLGEGVAQKAVKLWAQLSKWGKDFGLDDWNFIAKFLDLQKKSKAKGEVKEEKKISPDYTFIKDLVAGRPILTHPLRVGGFRLRYGRSRASGLASISIHPATMIILDNFIGIGTQLKYERPGKSTAVQPCDCIEGPIIKLKNGDVVFLESEEEAKKFVKDIEEILFLGDFLVNYGEFFNRAHNLVPAGYCEEWYALELEKAIKEKKNKDFYEKNKELIDRIIKESIKTKISAEEAIRLSENLKVPLHPRYTYHWKDISKEQFLSLLNYLKKEKVEEDKIILPLTYDVHREIAERDAKRVLELLGIPHKVVAKENIVIEKDWSKALLVSLGDLDKIKVKKENVLDIVNDNSTVKIRDKSGTFIGARMGRPEKAKMRKLTGSPQVLFPVGREGGRLRCFEAALEEGKVRAQFPIYFCENCKRNTIYYICEDCGSKCKKLYYCSKDNKYLSLDKCDEHGGEVESFKIQELDIKHYFKAALKKLDLRGYPELIKGVRGTSNKGHIPENLAKGILRASNDIYVNKDGTVRFDVTELPITHFKAKEIGISVEKLKELGYAKDIEGKPLTSKEQLVEIKPQDIILPAYDQGLEEGADEILFRVARFVDEEFERLYDLKKFYGLKSKEDLIGHLVIGLAPHTSAAIVGRIIGFSKTQGCYANPLWHSAMRRDCFSYGTNIPVYDGKSWQNVKIGEFVESLRPDKVVDSFGTLAKDMDKYKTLAYNTETKKIDVMPIKWFTKHTPTKLLNLKLENGRELKVTENHKFYVYNDDGVVQSRAFNLKKGDKLIVPYNYKCRGMRIEHDGSYAYPKIVDMVKAEEETTYCLNVPGHHNVIANGIIAKQCEGDETCVMLLMDALLNFSRQYLPAHRGATQDAPLVITSRLVAAEVDDMVFDLDVAWKYPLEFYEAAEQYKDPREVSCIEQLKKRLGKAEQYYDFGFTHNTEDINQGVRCSAYKSIPNMQDKVRGQMKIAEKIRAVDEADVARLIIERHFIRDIKGNLRKFSMQQFRCTRCNEKYRRPPLIGRCIKCGGNVIFTIAEGGIVKYLEPSIELAEKYALPPYLKQSLELTRKRIESVFGKEEDKQEGLIKWFG